MPKNNGKLSSLTVFFPCYNEEESLPKLLDQAQKIVPKLAKKYEILVINDGSTDSTKKVAVSYAEQNPSIKVINQRNQGYGGAVNTGLRSARYEWVFFTDADLQFDLSDLEKFVKKALEGKDDLVIGYRKNRAEGFKRDLMAKGMKLWNRFWLGFPISIKDIDCAFKLIKREVIKNTLPLQSRGNLVSTEFLLKAHKAGYVMSQIGVKHYARQSGESKCGGIDSVFRVMFETFSLMWDISKTPISTKRLFAKLAFRLR